MKTEIDTTYTTVRRDVFDSGMAAQIGMGALGLWIAIKNHANFKTGLASPGMRRLSELTGMSLGKVQSCVDKLVEHKLLRIETKGKGKQQSTYIARERMDVRLGDRVLCTIVIDYVPLKIPDQLKKIEDGVDAGKTDAETFAECEIIPGPGFVWDAEAGVLRAPIPHSEIPQATLEERLRRTSDHPAVRKAIEMEKKHAPVDDLDD